MKLHNELKAGPPFVFSIWWFDEQGKENLVGPLSRNAENWFFRQLQQVKMELKPFVVEIAWDTHHVHPKAIHAAIERLEGMDLDVNVHIHFYFHGWCREKYDNALWALERIQEIEECKSVTPFQETRILDCSISEVHYTNPRLRNEYRSWEKSKGNFEKIDLSDLARVLPYALMFRPDEKEEDLIYSWVGTQSVAARVNSLEWVAESIGQVTHRAFGNEDQSFAEKVNLGIVKALMTGEPVFQHVRTLVRLEDDEPFWMPYQRLLTRYRLKDGRFAVLSDVFPTRHIDIPLAGTP